MGLFKPGAEGILQILVSCEIYAGCSKFQIEEAGYGEMVVVVGDVECTKFLGLFFFFFLLHEGDLQETEGAETVFGLYLLLSAEYEGVGNHSVAVGHVESDGVAGFQL